MMSMQKEAERFVRIWQSSSSCEEAAKRFGCVSAKSAGDKAGKYRQRGIPLKEMVGRRGAPIDWKKIRRASDEALKKAKRKFETAVKEKRK
jgi:hypothetical protein